MTPTTIPSGFPLPLRLARVDHPLPGDAEVWEQIRRIEHREFYDEVAQINIGDDGIPLTIKAGEIGNKRGAPTYDRFTGQGDQCDPEKPGCDPIPG